MSVVTTYLELRDAAAVRPAAAPRLPGLEVTRVEPPDGALNRWFYVTVGAAHRWTDHAGRDAEWWRAHAAAVETWVATTRGARAGYFELEAGPEGVEIAYLGVLPAYQGVGLGGHLVTLALRRGLQLGERVWVHTCTLDGPAALPNYVARGLREYRRESE